MALPNAEEKALLEKFREKVADALCEEQVNNDMFLVRWLRARELNLEKSEEMLRNAMKWRKENHSNAEAIPIEKLAYYTKNFPYWLDGVDKSGRPICTAPFGKWDAREVIKEGKSAQLISYINGGYERSEKAIEVCRELYPPSSEDIPPVTQFRLIVDWKGFAWTQIFSFQSIQTLLQIAYINEAYFPEMLHSCWFLNCPTFIFNGVLTLVKPFVSARTLAKVRCFSSDRNTWEKEILSEISPEQVRPEFGGTKTDDSSPFAQ